MKKQNHIIFEFGLEPTLSAPVILNVNRETNFLQGGGGGETSGYSLATILDCFPRAS